MAGRYLIPAKDVGDAREAISMALRFAESGDEFVVLVISDVPAGELIGSEPPATVLDPLATTGGVASSGRAGSDTPEFVGREELMEMEGREIIEAIQPHIAALHQQGFEARGQAVFSDNAGATIRDVARDISATDVLVTRDFHEELDADTQELVKAL